MQNKEIKYVHEHLKTVSSLADDSYIPRKSKIQEIHLCPVTSLHTIKPVWNSNGKANATQNSNQTVKH